MNPLRALLLPILISLPLAAQYLTGNGEAKILVPHAPFVTGKITRILLLHYPEAGSGMITSLLAAELVKIGLFEVVVPGPDDPSAKDIKGLGDLSKSGVTALAAKYKASHVAWLRLDRFHYVSASGKVAARLYKFKGSASGELYCSVLDLGTGEVKSSTTLNLVKEIEIESMLGEPSAPDEPHARDLLNEVGVRRAVQLFIPVHEVRKLPLFTDGGLGELKEKLKSGDLDGTIALARTIQGTSASESPKFKGRLAYDFALLLLMKNQNPEALKALEEARQSGKDKSEIDAAMEACKQIIENSERIKKQG
ncbi:MAG: hypothetical protein IPP78_05185 [Holophagaceae bacterium]|nr:hypothetical protein [Holophagaceae bacterium]